MTLTPANKQKLLDEKLQPCPTCGPAKSRSGKVLLPHQFGYYEPYLKQFQADGYRDSDIWVECDKCGLCLGTSVNGFSTNETAIKAWNDSITSRFVRTGVLEFKKSEVRE